MPWSPRRWIQPRQDHDREGGGELPREAGAGIRRQRRRYGHRHHDELRGRGDRHQQGGAKSRHARRNFLHRRDRRKASHRTDAARSHRSGRRGGIALPGLLHDQLRSPHAFRAGARARRILDAPDSGRAGERVAQKPRRAERVARARRRQSGAIRSRACPAQEALQGSARHGRMLWNGPPPRRADREGVFAALSQSVKSFVYNGLPARVVFGPGTIGQLPAEVARLGAKRVLLLATPGRAEMVAAVSKNLPVVGIFDKVQMHTPVEIANQARELAQELKADCCVAVGGGSTIGFGKAIALTSGLPVLAVPTTYSGSEMTTIWGISEKQTKRTGRDPKVLPKTVVYDPELTLDLPPHVSAASGMNAIAHCVEALYAHDGNPIVSLMAEEGIRALSKALPVIVREPKNLEARSEALYGAWLAGATISTTSVALHHKLCHVLGGLGLPHAETHSIVLPHAVRYNYDAAREAMARVERALGSSPAPAAIYDLETKLGIAMSLSDIGLKEADLERAARIAAEAPYPNPRKVEYAPVLELLRNAHAGRRPT